MINVVTTNNANVNIVNPTVYYPDAVIGKYCIANNTNVNAEIQKRVKKGASTEVAAQDLFTRAVRYDESIQHKKIVILAMTLNSFLNHIGTYTWLDLLFFIALEYCCVYLIIQLMHHFLIAGVTDKLGVNIQYSI